MKMPFTRKIYAYNVKLLFNLKYKNHIVRLQLPIKQANAEGQKIWGIEIEDRHF